MHTIIDNWIISSIAIIGTIRGTIEEINAPYSISANHPSIGIHDYNFVPKPLSEGAEIGLMDMGMFTLGTPAIQGIPVVDNWIYQGNGKPVDPTGYENTMAKGLIMGQYRDTTIEFCEHLNPLNPAPMYKDINPDYMMDTTNLGLVLLGKRMNWNSTIINND